MKVAILGATGNTGLQLVKQALERGHNVTAIVRSPEKLASFNTNPNFKAVKCDILNSSELAKSIEGQDCVLSALGYPGFNLFKVKFYLESIQSIVLAMRQSELKRLICVTSFYTKPDGENYPTAYKVILRPMIGRQLDSMYEMEQWLFKECSDIDYTIVRPPRLTDESLKDVKELALENAYLFADNQETVNQIPRANVARFILDTLQNNEYLKKAVAINLPK